MGAGSWESYHAITTLLFRYAECIDAADFDGIGRLFAAAKITNEGYDAEIVGADAVADLYRSTNRVHDDGTLRTRHLTTNVIVDIDEAAGTAHDPLRVRRVPGDSRRPAATDRERPLPRRVRARATASGRSRTGTSCWTTSATSASTCTPGLVAQLHDPGASAPSGSA